MLIDAHLHLDQYPVEKIDEYIAAWQQAGVEKIVAVSTNLASSYRTLEWKAKYPHFIYAAIGYHPEQSLPREQEIDELLALLKKERKLISAIGEVGLPYYSLDKGKAPQEVLEAFLELLSVFTEQAKREHLPILLHAVHEQAAIALAMLVANQIEKAHFHWLKASPQVVEEIVARGYYISVTPEVCYRQRDQQLLRQVPLERLLLETDGPWPYEERFSGRLTTPLFLEEVAEQVALIKQMEKDTVLYQCRQNLVNLFGE